MLLCIRDETNIDLPNHHEFWYNLLEKQLRNIGIANYIELLTSIVKAYILYIFRYPIRMQFIPKAYFIYKLSFSLNTGFTT